MLKDFTDTHTSNSFAWLLHWWYHYRLQQGLVGLKITSVLVCYFNSGHCPPAQTQDCRTHSIQYALTFHIQTVPRSQSTHPSQNCLPILRQTGRRGLLSHSQTSSVAWEWHHLTYWPHRLVVTSLKWVGLIIVLAVQQENTVQLEHTHMNKNRTEGFATTHLKIMRWAWASCLQPT